MLLFQLLQNPKDERRGQRERQVHIKVLGIELQKWPRFFFRLIGFCFNKGENYEGMDKAGELYMDGN